MIMKYNLTILEQSLYIVTKMNIHTVNEQSDMQANKLNAKYHLYVQHSKAIASRIQDPARAQEY